MKRKLIFSAAILAAALALTSCGDSGDDGSSKSKSKKSETSAAAEETITQEEPTETKELGGAPQTWGIYTVLVPEGWTLRKGDVLDENDPNYCSVKASDFKYYDFKSENEKTQQNQYNYNKNTYTNEQKDIPATTIAGIEWTGFEYGNDFGGGFELYASSNGKFLRVSSAGFAFDGPETKAILESLKIS